MIIVLLINGVSTDLNHIIAIGITLNTTCTMNADPYYLGIPLFGLRV